MADEALTTQVRPPQAARIVVIGGGIMGCSVAYHLSSFGETDVVLLEQGRLTSGTTWHAAGLVGQLRNHESMTRLIRYSTDLYSRLEGETGLSTGWKQCGSLAVARTTDRMVQLKRTAAVAQAFGVTCDVISPSEAGELYPIMATADLKGAVWLPGDGKANPADLTLALAKGARNRGVKICEGTRVTGARTVAGAGKRISHLEWSNKAGESGRIAADIVVLCGGQWSRALGRTLGVAVPLFSCEHYYIVTDVIPGVHRDLPVMRDPDGYIYFKEEVGGLLMGGFEPHATPWLQSAQHRGGIPENFEFQLLPDNWDAFQVLLDNAMIRVPALEQAQVKQFYNGPESFTADNNFIVGPAPGIDNLYVGCGFNSMGIASGGGAGKALAEWIIAGEPALDLWPVDIRRFARFNANETWLPDRIAEVLGMHYKMPWPNRELESARPFRRSPLYAATARRRCLLRFQDGVGARQLLRTVASPGDDRVRLGPPELASVGRRRASRLSRGGGRVRHELLRQAASCRDRMPGPRCSGWWPTTCRRTPGATVYTGMLNDRGGYESDFTITCVDDEQFMVVTSSGSAVRDRDIIERALRSHGWRATVTDVTPMFAMLAVMGPRARELMSRVSTARFDNDSFPFGTSQEIDLGYATVRATRLTYVGELGWELYTPVEFAVGVYERLIGRRARPRIGQRRLLRDRLAATGKGLPRVEPRTDAGYQPVRGGARLCGQTRQGRRLPRSQGTAGTEGRRRRQHDGATRRLAGGRCAAH